MARSANENSYCQEGAGAPTTSGANVVPTTSADATASVRSAVNTAGLCDGSSGSSSRGGSSIAP